MDTNTATPKADDVIRRLEKKEPVTDREKLEAIREVLKEYPDNASRIDKHLIFQIANGTEH